MRTPLVAGLALVALSACNWQPVANAPAAAANAAPANVAQTSAPPPVAEAAPAAQQPMQPVTPAAPPPHQWFAHTNGEYGYTEGPAGAVASRVVMLRYYGYQGGLDTLLSYTAGYLQAQCARPCQTIRVVDAHGVVRQVAYDPDSVIGHAFADAETGQLEVYAAPAPVRAAPVPVAHHDQPPTPAYVPPTYQPPVYAPPGQYNPYGPRPWRRRMRPYLNREGGYVDPNAAG
jgi:hypothetical protein